eukprot:gene4560-4998_t
MRRFLIAANKLSRSYPQITYQPCTLSRRFLHEKPTIIRSGGASFNKEAKKEIDSLEKEKELYHLKRLMGQHHTKGDYEAALLVAVEMQEKAAALYGETNPVYASCLNNTALMQKLADNGQGAMDNYIKALQLYADLPTHGKRSAPYLATLANLGLLFKDLASRSKGMERFELLQRSEEALVEVLNVRRELHGLHHKDTIAALLGFATLQRARGEVEKSIDLFREALEAAIQVVGPEDLLTATIYNNMGLAQKSKGDFDSALTSYRQAYFIRTRVLGDKHTETIVCLHNEAECLLAAGKEKESQALQHRILSLLPVPKEELKPSSSPSSNANETHPSYEDGKPLSARDIVNNNELVRDGGVGKKEPPKPVAKPKPPLYTPATRRKR